MSKVQKIIVKNAKAISSLEVNFNGASCILVGPNNSGKSTFLKSLPDRIRGLKPELVLKLDEKEGFEELWLTTGEKFIWTFNQKGEKLVFITEKNIKSSVTKDIATYYFPKTFDVDEFLNSTPAKQKATLQKLTGIDFTEIDKVYKDAYDQRAFFNKQLSIEQAKFLTIDSKLPVKEIKYEAEQNELNGIEAHNLRFENVEKGYKERLDAHDENKKEIEALLLKVKALELKNETILAELVKASLWIGEDKNKPKTNKDELSEKITGIKKKNQEIAENNKAIAQDKVIDKARSAAQEWDTEVKRIDAEKLEVIKNSTLPEGFGFSDEGITYQGFEFSKQQLSSSGIYIAALKLAQIGLGDCKMLHFDASTLDKKSLEEVQKWAESVDCQLMIERPSFEGKEISYELIQG